MTVKGSLQPLKIFTVSMQCKNLKTEADRTVAEHPKKRQADHKLEKEAIAGRVFQGKNVSWDLI